jgi:hypothetical protein
MTAPKRQHGHAVEKVERACIKKLRYPDELTARAAGMHYIDHYEHDAPKKLWWYKCPHCAGVHLTSNDNGRKFNVAIF